MEYEHKDSNGEVKKYEISYSQQLQKEQIVLNNEIKAEIKKSNRLKLVLMLGALLIVILLLLIVLDTGALGEVARRGICSTCGGGCTATI